MFRFFFRITNKSVGGFGFFLFSFIFFLSSFFSFFVISGPPKLAPQFFIRSDLIVTPSWLSLRRFDSLDGLSIHQFSRLFSIFFFQSSSLRDVSLIHSSVSNVFFFFYYFSDVRWTISGQSSLIFVKKKRKKEVGTIYRSKNFTFYVIGRFVCKILNALQQ